MAEGLERRHGVGLAGGAPDLLGFGIASDADVARHLVVVRCYVLIGNRPVDSAAVLAFDPEIVGEEPRKIGEVVQGGATHAPARLIAVSESVLAFEQERRACGL